jgi:hypothetical protein
LRYSSKPIIKYVVAYENSQEDNCENY